jgi:hypothetical protein
MRTSKDWSQSCPNPECTHYSRMKRGDVSAIVTYLIQSGAGLGVASPPAIRLSMDSSRANENHSNISSSLSVAWAAPFW